MGRTVTSLPEGYSLVEDSDLPPGFSSVDGVAEAQPQYSKTDAFMAGGGQGATLGRSDELAAMVGLGTQEQNQQKLQQAQEQHPIMYGLGEVAGGISGAVIGAPLIARAASAVPAVSNFIARNVGRNGITKALGTAATGGAAGGVYGYNTGTGGPEERAQNAQTGAAFGSAGGLAGAGLARMAEPVVNKIGSLAERARNLFTKKTVNNLMTPAMPQDVAAVGIALQVSAGEQDKAMGKIVDAIRKDYGPNADAALASLKNGEVALSDLIKDNTPNLRGLAVGAAQYPQGRAITEQALAVKMGDRGARVSDSVARNIADFGGFNETMDDMVKAGQAKAAPLYEKAYADTIKDNKVLMVPEIQDAISRASKQYQSALQGSPANSVKTLDYAKKVLDADIEAAKRAGDRGLVRDRTIIKNNLVKAMDDASGSYKQARAVAGDYLANEEAMNAGKDVFKMRPELVRKQYKELSSETEKKAYKMGVVEAIRKQLDEMPASVDPYKKIIGTQGNKERLGALLSPAEYRAFEKDLRSEQKLFKFYADSIGGSNTVPKAKAAQAIDGGAVESILSAGGPKASILKAIKTEAVKMFDGISDNTAGIIADALYETNPTKKLAIIQKLKPSKGVLNDTEIKEAKRVIAEIDQALRKSRSTKPAAVAGGIAAAPRLQVTVRPEDKEQK